MCEPSQETSSQQEVLGALRIAGEYYRHGEMIVQSRMYNFLFGLSVLLLAWATLYSAKLPDKPKIPLFLFALTGFFLSTSFAIWGSRADKFQSLHRDRILFLEHKLPEQLRIMHSIADLQENGMVTLPSRKEEIKFSWLEFHVRAGRIAVAAPFVLALVSLALILLSL